MASTLTSSTLSGTYKDDYDETKGFHRLLFNTGRALQARELTQLQTIIQTEVSRFGRNIFTEGAAVNPGGPIINARYEFIKLNTATNALPSDPTTLEGVEFTGQTSGVKARVIEVVEAEGSDPATLYVQYTDTSAATSGTTNIRMSAAEDIVGGSTTLTVQTTNTTSNPAVGVGCRFSNGAGDFFALGHFVYAPAQSIILNKYSGEFTGVVGFIATTDVVTASDDSTLYDNSGATVDTTAPGADRLRIQLTLANQADVDSDDNFIFFAAIDRSVIAQNVTGGDDYNIPLQLLADRTFEESGNYVVKPFSATFEAGDSDGYLNANISQGIAYVYGHRARVLPDKKIQIGKARAFQTINNQITAADYGQYVLGDKTTGKNLPDVGDVVNLRSAATYGGSTMGTAAVRYVHDDGDNLRVYLFNIQMSSGQSFRNVLSLGVSTSDYIDTVQENSKTVLYDANKRDALFALPIDRPKSLTDISLEVGRWFTGTSNGSGELTLTLTAGGETFVNTGDWYVVDNSSGGEQTGTSFSGSGTASVTISGLDNSTSYTVWTKVDKSSGSVRSKTLTNATLTSTVDSDGNGVEVLDLGQADIYQVNSIREDSAGGADISHRFEVDYGRRPSYYDQGRLVVPANQTPPSGNVYVDFDYFDHGSTGDFFAVNSYIGQVDYENIPSDTLADGTEINLRDYLDFRPTWTGSAFTDINELPENSNSIRADVSYYLARNDLIVLDQSGEVWSIPGEPNFNPLFPAVPENTIEIFRLAINPYTLDENDLTVRAINHKRYTMKDIAAIDQRVESLRELTTLNLLEVDTNNISIYDSAGLDRTKAGFLVDNFNDFSSTHSTAADYRASIDPQSKIMRPGFKADNIRLIYDSDKSTNVIMKGDNVYLSYTETSYINQDQVSGTENINPFAVVSGRGYLTLSPSSDEWKEVVYTAAKAVSGGTKLVQQQSMLWNEWLWEWAGTSLANGIAGQEISTSSKNKEEKVIDTWSNGSYGGDVVKNTTTTTTHVATVLSNEVIKDVIDDRQVDLALIPFMRSRKVWFRAEGLRPNSRFFAFFDGVPVADWVREETFVHFGTDTTDWGNLHQDATEHPDGPSNLVSDANGKIEGSFWIPSTPTTRFRVGTRELKLLDISVNNDTEALSGAATDFAAAGVLETRQKTIRSTRYITIDIDRDISKSSTTSNVETWRYNGGSSSDNGIKNWYYANTTNSSGSLVRTDLSNYSWVDSLMDEIEDSKSCSWNDPLAQTILVTNKRGIFVTKIAVYFQSKDDTIPVQLQIRPTMAGVPQLSAIPGAVKFLNPSEVNVVSTQTQAGVLATPTYFEFDEPIYLAPGEEYAIVLAADSVNYNVYVSETEQFVLGSTERRITRQPYLGSLLKSQNGSTWTPSQKQDLTFELFTAQFSTDEGVVVLENADVPAYALASNPFTFVSSDATVTVYHPNHGFDVNDTVTIAGVSGTVAGITAANLNGNRTVTAVDQTGYTFEAGSAATSSQIGGGTGITATRNILFDVAVPFIQTMNPVGSFMAFGGQFTTGKSFAGSETRFSKDANAANIPNRENLFFNAPRMIANPTDEASELGSGERSATISIPVRSADPLISPVIDTQRASMYCISNIIDNQSSSALTLHNVPLNYVAETSATGGSSIAKHITRPVTLAADSVGLKILLSANRPSVADFDVYYRTGADGDILSDVDWTLIAAEESVPSDENPSVFREYRYLPGGEGGSLDPFTQYQIKIVMNSSNSSKVPVFRDLRVIALAD